MSDITRGEYHALIATWRHSPTTQPRGVQWRTLQNLVTKGLLESETRVGGYEYYWLTDAGKKAMDEYPHKERIAQ